MFFLRCAFWLSIVYASISWPNGMGQGGDLRATLAGARHASVTALTEKAIGEIKNLCATRINECLEDASRLTALVAASEPADEGPAAGEAPVDSVVPMPVPDPRRAGRGEKIARLH